MTHEECDIEIRREIRAARLVLVLCWIPYLFTLPRTYRLALELGPWAIWLFAAGVALAFSIWMGGNIAFTRIERRIQRDAEDRMFGREADR